VGPVAWIDELLVSAGHRWDGRPTADLPPGPDETVDRIEVRAGLGVVGDRYFNRPAHRDASVTLIAAEVLQPWAAGLRQTRRTVLLSGVDVDAGLGRTLSLDTGEGAVLLAVRRAAHPCRWLDLTVGDGAWKALRGHGGVRCEPLTDGVLRVGAVQAVWLD
jgi:MOSC domain-containing protein YiiM